MVPATNVALADLPIQNRPLSTQRANDAARPTAGE